MESEQQFYAQFGERLKKARKEKGLTQADLAQKMQVSINSIRLYEAGTRSPSMATLNKMAAALNVDVNWLFQGYTLEQHDEAFFRRVRHEPPLSERELYLLKHPNDEPAQQEQEDLEARIIRDFRNLNAEGQRVAAERLEELTQLPKYQQHIGEE